MQKKCKNVKTWMNKTLLWSNKIGLSISTNIIYITGEKKLLKGMFVRITWQCLFDLTNQSNLINVYVNGNLKFFRKYHGKKSGLNTIYSFCEE